MSSSINDRRHFDSIAAGIKKLLQCRDFYPSKEIARHFPGMTAYSRDVDMSRVDDLVGMLIAIQVESVCRQYPVSGKDIEVYIAEQRQAMSVPARNPKVLSPVALLKALGCCFYQIERWRIDRTRGMTPEEEDCLAFFRLLRSEVAEYIVGQLPGYKKAEWDITT